MRGDITARQMRLLQLLEARPEGLEVDDAATALGRGRRTVYRDFEILQQIGIPLVADREGTRARWRVMEGYRHRLQVSLTWSEVLAISTGSRLLSGLAGTLFHEGAVSALEKIRATLPRALHARVRAMEGMVSASRGGRDYTSRGAILKTLVEAIEQRRCVIAVYRSRTGEDAGRSSAAERMIDPYHLRVSERSVYVVGYCHKAAAVRTFLLDRFVEARLTEQRFEMAPDFEAEQFVKGSFGMWSGTPVEVSFTVDASAARYFFENKVHPTQVAQRNADGSADVTIRAAVGPPMVSFLMGLGPALRRVKPEALRKAVAKAHREAAAALSRPKRVGGRVTMRQRKRGVS